MRIFRNVDQVTLTAPPFTHWESTLTRTHVVIEVSFYQFLVFCCDAVAASRLAVDAAKPLRGFGLSKRPALIAIAQMICTSQLYACLYSQESSS